MVTGGAGGSSGSSGSSRFTSDSDSDDANTLIVINPEAVPRAAIPDDDNTKDMTVIQDEEVPLFALPKTGDTQHTLLWLLLTAVSALGILLIGWKRKRKDNEGE
jgi:LPXTG-motif cell wall-anchored protein